MTDIAQRDRSTAVVGTDPWRKLAKTGLSVSLGARTVQYLYGIASR